jgi:hypothetical protein
MQGPWEIPLEDDLVETKSIIRGVIPILPLQIAWLAFFINFFVPGIGKNNPIP